MTEEEKQKIIEELKLQKAYAHKINNLQIKMITGCALNLIQKQDTEINKLNKEIKQLKEDISNMYDEKVVRNILEDYCDLSKDEIEELLN